MKNYKLAAMPMPGETITIDDTVFHVTNLSKRIDFFGGAVEINMVATSTIFVAPPRKITRIGNAYKKTKDCNG